MPWSASSLSHSHTSPARENASSFAAKRGRKVHPGKPSAEPTAPGGAPSSKPEKWKARHLNRHAPAAPEPKAPKIGGPAANSPAPAGPAAPPASNGNAGNASASNEDTGNASASNEDAGNASASNEDAGNASASNGNAGNASASNGNVGNASANGNTGASNGNAGNANAGAGAANASNGNSGNGNAGNGNSGNSNAGTGATNAANGNSGNGNGSSANGNAGNGNSGNGNSGNTPAAVAPGMTVVTWMPPGLARKEDGALPHGLADRLTDDFGLPPGLRQILERRSVTLSREQSTLAPRENPRAALRLQMHRAAARYAAMSVSTQFATMQNERAIHAARSGPAPMSTFFGWLRIR